MTPDPTGPRPPADPARVEIHDLAVRYEEGGRAAPSAATFTARAGEVVLLLGPSGCGKSTLTLTVNGLIPHAIDAETTGSVRVAGLETRDHPPAELSTHVGMVFQDPDAQIITGTVFDEVAFALENLRMPVDDVQSRSEAALRRMGIWDRRDDDPATLSGGGRQRLAIACALATDTPVIVLDEPTANLDPAGVLEVHAALRDVAARGDRVILLVEHNLDSVVDLATRVVVLDETGATAFDGPTTEVLREETSALERLGVWLPGALVAAMRLRETGWRMDPLPLTPADLDALLTAPSAPAPSPHASGEPDETPRVVRATAAPALRARGLTVRRGGRTLLRDVSLDLPRGSFTAVIGPNGAGKTTLVHALAGVVPPPRGTVEVDGMDVGRASPRTISSRVGFVFQNPEHQFVTHTVADELAHGLRIRRVPEPEIRRRVDDMLGRFGLTDHAGAHPFRLSGGQKRRLSVGTALIAGPDVLVLDEPTFGQDRSRAEELLGLLDALHRDGTTVVVVTHDLGLASRHASEVAVVAGGRLLRIGPTREVLDDAELLEAAGLVQPPMERVLARHPDAARLLRPPAARR